MAYNATTPQTPSPLRQFSTAAENPEHNGYSFPVPNGSSCDMFSVSCKPLQILTENVNSLRRLPNTDLIQGSTFNDSASLSSSTEESIGVELESLTPCHNPSVHLMMAHQELSIETPSPISFPPPPAPTTRTVQKRPVPGRPQRVFHAHDLLNNLKHIPRTPAAFLPLASHSGNNGLPNKESQIELSSTLSSSDQSLYRTTQSPAAQDTAVPLPLPSQIPPNTHSQSLQMNPSRLLKSYSSSPAERYTAPEAHVAIPPSRTTEPLPDLLMYHHRQSPKSADTSTDATKTPTAIPRLQIQQWTFPSPEDDTDTETEDPQLQVDTEDVKRSDAVSWAPLPFLRPRSDDEVSSELGESTGSESGKIERAFSESEFSTTSDSVPQNGRVEGHQFQVSYLGSTRLLTTDERPNKATRLQQAQEALERIQMSAEEGKPQPSTPVILFVSLERLMVLEADHRNVIMDYSLRSIAYIADFGETFILMARNPLTTTTTSTSTTSVPPVNGVVKPPHERRIACHIFHTTQSQVIAQTIGKTFQAAYMQFLRSNGIEEPSEETFKDMNYQDVLNQQQLHMDELNLLANKESQKEVMISKAVGEPLGVMIVESGWGSMVPTVVVSNLHPTGPAAKAGLVNIGNQIMAVNGVSLVGLPLSNCQQILKKCRRLTSVKLSLVCSSPVVDVFIRRPTAKFQLGFSVQNGVVCSLLRGGIAERGGVRVGHRIIEVNGQSVVAMPHERIVHLLASAMGQIHIRTMPAAIFRLLTGQDAPHYI